MAETTKRDFILRATQEWEYRITAESPDDAEAIFEELGSSVGKGMCTGYSIEAVVSADKKDDYDAEDERAKCTCGHLLYGDHSATGCIKYRCDCTGATPLPLGEEQ